MRHLCSGRKPGPDSKWLPTSHPGPRPPATPAVGRDGVRHKPSREQRRQRKLGRACGRGDGRYNGNRRGKVLATTPSTLWFTLTRGGGRQAEESNDEQLHFVCVCVWNVSDGRRRRLREESGKDLCRCSQTSGILEAFPPTQKHQLSWHPVTHRAGSWCLSVRSGRVGRSRLFLSRSPALSLHPPSSPSAPAARGPRDGGGGWGLLLCSWPALSRGPGRSGSGPSLVLVVDRGKEEGRKKENAPRFRSTLRFRFRRREHPPTHPPRARPPAPAQPGPTWHAPSSWPQWRPWRPSWR